MVALSEHFLLQQGGAGRSTTPDAHERAVNGRVGMGLVESVRTAQCGGLLWCWSTVTTGMCILPSARHCRTYVSSYSAGCQLYTKASITCMVPPSSGLRHLAGCCIPSVHHSRTHRPSDVPPPFSPLMRCTWWCDVGCLEVDLSSS